MTKSISPKDVQVIIFACEAGIGSSLMSVNSLKKKLKKAKVTSVKVVHKPARQVPENAPLIVCHKGLAKMVRKRAPDSVVVAFNHFFNDPALDRIVQAFADGTDIVEEG
jgi:PTS system mannitol-specific IIB component